MEKSSFFNSVNGDRRYSATEWAEYFKAFIGNGVYGKDTANLQVLSNSNMTIGVNGGTGFINGYFYTNTDKFILDVETADGINPRIDIVVLRLDLTARKVGLRLIKGVASATAQPPQLVRNANTYDLKLCEVTIPKGATSITQANIKDTRAINEVCGWVTGVIDQVDTTGLFGQFETAFNTWFDYIKGQFSDDAVGSLQTQIDTWNVFKANGGEIRGNITLPNNHGFKGKTIGGVSADMVRINPLDQLVIGWMGMTTNPVVYKGMTAHEVYHQGNKPTATDVKALPITGGTVTGGITVKQDYGTINIQKSDGTKNARIQHGSDNGSYVNLDLDVGSADSKTITFHKEYIISNNYGNATLGTPSTPWRDAYIGGNQREVQGYTKLTNGMIMQWGFTDISVTGGYGGRTINPSIKFPTDIVSAYGNARFIGTNWSNNVANFNVATAWTNDGLISLAVRDTTASASNNTIRVSWVAIGY